MLLLLLPLLIGVSEQVGTRVSSAVLEGSSREPVIGHGLELRDRLLERDSVRFPISHVLKLLQKLAFPQFLLDLKVRVVQVCIAGSCSNLC